MIHLPVFHVRAEKLTTNGRLLCNFQFMVVGVCGTASHVPRPVGKAG